MSQIREIISMSKARYRIRNWRDYNRSLVQRGSITIWFSQDAIDKWHANPTGKRGRPSRYSDDAILTALLIRFVFHLPLRALEGFLSSLVSTMCISLHILAIVKSVDELNCSVKILNVLQ